MRKNFRLKNISWMLLSGTLLLEGVLPAQGGALEANFSEETLADSRSSKTPMIGILFNVDVGGLTSKALRRHMMDLGAEIRDVDYQKICPTEPSSETFHPQKADLERLYLKKPEPFSKENEELSLELDDLLATLNLNNSYAEKSLKGLDGLIVPGNNFDVNPLFYHKSPRDGGKYCAERSLAELKMLSLACTRGVPIFAECGGLHIINVAFGGTLRENTLYNNDHVNVSMIYLESSTLKKIVDLKEIIGQIEAWRSHRWSIDKLGGGDQIQGAPTGQRDFLQVSAKENSKTIAAVESVYGSPFRALQFHSGMWESIWNIASKEANKKILQSFIKEAQVYQNKKQCLAELCLNERFKTLAFLLKNDT